MIVIAIDEYAEFTKDHWRKLRRHMENQHRQIKGYRELSQAEIDLMNEIKAQGVALEALIEKLLTPGPGYEHLKADPRWVAIGRTHLQEGLMALTRSVAKPTFF